MYIDTHAHIQDKSFADDFENMLERSLAAGVKKVIVPGSDFITSVKALEIAKRFERVFAALGVHPHDSKGVSEARLDEIEKMCLDPKVVAVGEIGLDFHYNFSEPAVQADVFIKQIKMAKRLGKPLVLHSRESQKELIDILDKEGASEVGGVVHCFSGSRQEAEILLEMGFYLGFTGVITFPKAQELRDVVSITPIDRILSETDSPYLAPIPYRGKRNEPSYVVMVVEKLAEIKGVPVNEMARHVEENTSRLFRID